MASTNQCLVCNKDVGKGGVFKNIFQDQTKRKLPLKERLEKVLVEKLDPETCHSPYLCGVCEKKLAHIENYYQILLEFQAQYKDTFNQHRQLAEATQSVTLTQTALNFLVNSGLWPPPGPVQSVSTLQPTELSVQQPAWEVPDGATIQIQQAEEQMELDQQQTYIVCQAVTDGDKSGAEEGQAAAGRIYVVQMSGSEEQGLTLEENKLEEPQSALDSISLSSTLSPPVLSASSAENVADFIMPVSEDSHAEYTLPLPVAAQPENWAFSEPNNEFDSEPLSPPRPAPLPQPTQDSCDVCSKTIANGQETVTTEKSNHCSHCHKTFSSSAVLREHSLLHTQDRRYKCCHCSRSFTYRSSLRSHVRSHNDAQSFPCLKCPAIFPSSKDLSHHLCKHHDCGLHTCIRCKASFKDYSMLRKHLIRHSGMRPFKCKICGKEFTQSGSLYTHMKSHSSNTQYQCHVCDKRFKYKMSWKLHLRIHSGEKKFTCNECQQSFLYRNTYQLHLAKHTGVKEFKCKDCGASFFKKFQLQKHVVIHGEKKHICNVCDVKFYRVGHLKAHMVSHDQGKAIKCSLCGAEFAWPESLAAHMKTHTANAAYNCEKCEVGFSTELGLKRHVQRIHCQKPTCDFCSMTFETKSKLIHHMTTAHRGKISCKDCGKKYKTGETYMKHMRVCHVGSRQDPEPSTKQPQPQHRCSFCDKTFKLMESLKAHENQHKRLKPYVCKVCGAGFTGNNGLKSHSRKHTDQRPHVCTVCQSAFKTTTNLKKHMKVHGVSEVHDTRLTRAQRRSVTCPLCNVPFHSKCALLRHKRLCRST